MTTSAGWAMDLKEITSNMMFIENGFMKTGADSFRLSNIVSLSVVPDANWEQVSSGATAAAHRVASRLAAIVRNLLIIMLPIIVLSYVGYQQHGDVVLLTLIFVGPILAMLCVIIIIVVYYVIYFAGKWLAYELIKREYYSEIADELRITTNAGTTFWLSSKDRKFLSDVKNAIEEAQDQSSGVAGYNINIHEHKIERMETEMINIIDSPGANVAHKSRNVTQSSNAVQSDISELIRIVNTTNTKIAGMLKEHLGVVQNYFSGGGRTRNEAKQSWGAFVQHIGALAQSGNHILELAARIGAALY